MAATVRKAIQELMGSSVYGPNGWMRREPALS